MRKKLPAPKAKIVVGLVAVGALLWGWQQQQTPAKNSAPKVSNTAAAVPGQSASVQATPSRQGQ